MFASEVEHEMYGAAGRGDGGVAVRLDFHIWFCRAEEVAERDIVGAGRPFRGEIAAAKILSESGVLAIVLVAWGVQR